MADEIKIGLDGAPLTNAAKPVLDALAQLDALVTQLGNNSSLNRLNKEAKTAVSSLREVANSVTTDMGKFVTGVTSAVDKVAAQAKPRAKLAGQAIGKELADAMEDSVSKAKVNLSAQKLVLPSGVGVSVSGRGLASESDVLAELKAIQDKTGALRADQVTAQARADAAQQAADNAYLAGRKKYAADLAREQQSEAAAAMALVRSQETANDRLIRSLATNQAALEADAARSSTYLAGRKKYFSELDAANSKAVQLEESQAVRAARANDTLLKNLASVQTSSATARNSSIDKNAAFQTSSPAAQVSRASRVNSAISLGMSDVDAVAKYGSAAVAASQDVEALRARQEALRAGSQALRGEQALLAERSNDVRSAFRGIAGAGDALFLTYGSIVPLTAAFFATTAVRQAIQDYKDLEYQIKFVQALQSGGMGMSEGGARAQLSAVATDAGFDPVEAAKGMRLLAQSGLDAKEALSALPAVLQTSTVGELSVAEAAQVLTGSVHAFGLDLDQIGRVGDVLAKAGAVSNTSVGQMAESMKQASTIAKQYNMSLEDTSTVLVALAKHNITGGAAGTATANMMRELANPKGGAKKAASTIGFTAFDSTGDVKNLFDSILPELRDKLSAFTVEAQKKIVSDLTNNRGEKAMVALLGMSDSDLQKIRDQLNGSTDFVKDANKTLMDSVEGDTKRLHATLATSLSTAGAAGANDFRDLLQDLQQIVSSPTFVSSVETLVVGFTKLLSVLVSVGSALTNPAVQFTAMGAALLAFEGPRNIASSGLTLLTGQFGSTSAKAVEAAESSTAVARAASAVAPAATEAAGAAGLMAGALGTVVRVFAGFAIITGVISLIGLLYEKMSEKSGTDLAIENGNRYIQSLEGQISAVNRLIDAKRQEAGQAPSGLQDLRNVRDQRQKEFDDAQSKHLGTDPNAAYFGGRVGRPVSDPNSMANSVQAKALADASAALLKADNLAIELAKQNRTNADGKSFYNVNQGDARDAALAGRSGLQAAHDNGFNPFQTFGTKGYDPSSSKGAARAATADYKNLLKSINEASAAATLQAAKDDETARLQEATAKAAYDRGLTDYTAYQAALDAIQKSQLSARVALAESEKARVDKALGDLQGKAQAMKAAKIPDVNDQVANDVAELQRKQAAAGQNVDKLRDDQAIQQMDVLTRQLAPSTAILKQSQESGALDDEHIQQEIKKLQLKGAGLELSEKEQTTQADILRILGEQNKKLAGDQATYDKQLADGAYNGPGAASQEGVAADLAARRAKLTRSTQQIRDADSDSVDNKQLDTIGKRFGSSIQSTTESALSKAFSGDKTGIQNLGTNLTQALTKAIADAFYTKFVKNAVDSLGDDLMSMFKSVASSVSTGSSIGSFLGLGGASTGIGAATAADVSAAGDGLMFLSGGGYTGDGGKYEAAGLVHKGEYVVNAASTKKLGLGFLESLNGYADGGYVGASSIAPSYGPSMPKQVSSGPNKSASPMVFSPSTTINVDSRSDRGAVIADVQRVVAANQKALVEQLVRTKKIPA